LCMGHRYKDHPNVAGLTLQRASLCAAQCPDLKARTHTLHLCTACCLSRSSWVSCVGWSCQDSLVQLLLSARRLLGFFTNGQPLVPPRCPGGEECVRVNSAWDLQGELHEAVAARLLGNKTTALRQRPHSQRLVSPALVLPFSMAARAHCADPVELLAACTFRYRSFEKQGRCPGKKCMWTM
jgi:hypothetical protein